LHPLPLHTTALCFVCVWGSGGWSGVLPHLLSAPGKGGTVNRHRQQTKHVRGLATGQAAGGGNERTSSGSTTAQRMASLIHCPGRTPPFWAVKRPARPHNNAIQQRHTKPITVGNAKCAATPRAGPDRAPDEEAKLVVQNPQHLGVEEPNMPYYRESCQQHDRS